MRSGFIMVLTLSILSLMVILVSFGINRVAAFRTASHLWTDRQKARTVAWSGISIACAQLTNFFKPEKKENKEEQEKLKNQQYELLFNGFNEWQTFTLKESIEGIDAELSIYISPEGGKLNLDGFSLDKNKIVYVGVTDNKKFLERLDTVFYKLTNKQDKIATPLIEGFLKEYVIPVDEVTLLLTVPTAKNIQSIFPQKESKDPYNLVDLFTIVATSGKINPLCLSQTIRYFCGITEKEKEYKKLPAKEILELLSAKKINWNEQWDKTVGQWYKKEYKSIPDEIKELFDTTCEMRDFLIICYARIGTALQKLAVLLARTSDDEVPFVIQKIYWL